MFNAKEIQFVKNKKTSWIVIDITHKPWPVDDPVQPQSDEDELKNVHWTQHLKLRGETEGVMTRAIIIFKIRMPPLRCFPSQTLDVSI